MFKLLNRFAWILSLSFWFIIIFIIIGSNGYRVNWEEVFFSWFFWVIAWLIIKKLLFSKTFIQNRLEFFANSLKQNYIENKEEKLETKLDIFEKPKEENKITNESNVLNTQEEKTKENKILEKNIEIEDLTNSKNYTENKNPTVIEEFFNKTTNYIKDFFSTNLLAKLGWILVFLAVVYFLKWVATAFWEAIWPVWRITIWIIIGFVIYLIWAKIQKSHKNEWIILIWTWILINFAVILAGRYLVWWDWYLTETTTFLFLILNTIFWVLTSLIYKSKTLLLFSFIFAYLNPLIIWAKPIGDPYTLVWYSLIVSLWALFISQKEQSISLFIIAFLAWNFLLLIAPSSNTSWEITKIIALNIYNIISILNASKFQDKYKLSLEITFWAAFLIIAWYLANINHDIINSDSYLYILAIITSLTFLVFAYIQSFKKTYLFSIWTIWTILTLAPLIIYKTILIQPKCGIYSCSIPVKENSNLMILSIYTIAIFAIINLALPFLNKKLFEKKSLSNLVFWILSAAVFFAFEIYNYWEIHFPWTIEGFAFLWLAIIYFLEWFFIINKLWIENVKKDENLKNIFYIFMGVSISLFSIAIAFVFSNYPEIISTTWLFEATILYYFYSKTNSPKIFTAATILFIIWLTKFGILLDVVHRGDFKFLISFAIILLSFILNLYFINKAEKKSYQNIHNALHIIWMLIMWGLLLKIIPSTGHGWSMLWISIFITILWSFYAKFNFNFLKIIFTIVLALFSISHIWELNHILWKLSYDKKEYLKFLQYIVTAIIISNYFIWDKLNLEKKYNKIILIIIWIYSFIISNLFILDLFEKIFGFYTLTIYWGLIASALLLYWIQKNIIKYRTIWLYFLTLTSAKIFLYDIWQIWNTNSRIAVFAILWVIFIILSTLYTKRFWDNMKWEFSFDNLKSNKINDKEVKSYNSTKKQDFLINQEIKNIDISKYKWVKFIFNNWKSISIRSKNLIKIAKLVTNNNKKTIFEKNELKITYDYVVNNYKTELSKANYKKILEIMEKFVEFWGEVKFIEK